MALDAGPFIRTGTRGSPSWPGSNPETGYVDADCSDQSADAACKRGGPYVDGTLCGLAVDDHRGRCALSPTKRMRSISPSLRSQRHHASGHLRTHDFRRHHDLRSDAFLAPGAGAISADA